MGWRPFDSSRMFNDASPMAGFTTAASPVVSVATVDMGWDSGDEQSPPEVVVAIENPTSIGSAGVIQIELQDSADGSTDWVTIQTGRVSAANASDMNPSRMYVPARHRKHLRTRYFIAGANFTGGLLTAGVV